jgi:Zn-dependent M28 family amino/carboxypeptidase
MAAQAICWLLLVVLLIQDLWEQFGGRGKFAPGANDNASGAAVVAALAESLAVQPPEKARVGYLFSGAEECGLYGSRQFAGYLAGKNFKGMVISVDMVGAGWKLQAISGAGALFRLESDRDVLELLERADPAIERLHYDRRSGDFEPFCRAGIRAAGIEAEGTKRSWRAYHSVDDDLDVIDPEMLTRTISALKQLVWLLDKGKTS